MHMMTYDQQTNIHHMNSIKSVNKPLNRLPSKINFRLTIYGSHRPLTTYEDILVTL